MPGVPGVPGEPPGDPSGSLQQLDNNFPATQIQNPEGMNIKKNYDFLKIIGV